MSKYIWLLDPGHGALINGTCQTRGKRSPPFSDGSILYEGVFNRDIASRIKVLCDVERIECENIVNSNHDVPLATRVSRANARHAADPRCRYISIHANGWGDGVTFNSAHGVSLFHYMTSKIGKEMAAVLLKHIVQETGLKSRGVQANMSWANFYVLRKTLMPAILSENGFMTNLEDATNLMKDDFRQKVALAHFNFIKEMESL
jgi:N-acetylmuramoyl-L-alanine amidase|tara:strand:+ start:5705 stop:6316 length:612 start_codon:yes stop_codon:yes gene_type:complete